MRGCNSSLESTSNLNAFSLYIFKCIHLSTRSKERSTEAFLKTLQTLKYEPL